jgi:hypothetical protein
MSIHFTLHTIHTYNTIHTNHAEDCRRKPMHNTDFDKFLEFAPSVYLIIRKTFLRDANDLPSLVIDNTCWSDILI